MGQVDAADAAACIGALQLLPENASALLRLEVASAAAAGGAPERGRSATPQRVTRILRHPYLEQVVAPQEDPYDDVVVEAARFHGGIALASSGLARDAVFVLGLLTTALNFSIEPRLPRDYVDSVNALGMAALRLSDWVLRTAKLERNQLPVFKGPSIHIPGPARLSQLKRTVSFTHEDIDALLAPAGLDHRALDPITQEFGGSPITSANEMSVVGRPIVRFGDRFILVSPLGIVNAVRYQILRQATAAGLGAALSQRFHEAVIRQVGASLREMGMAPLDFTPSTESVSHFSEAFFKLDDDKVAYCQIVTEDLAAYDGDRVHIEWNRPDLMDGLLARQATVAEEVRCALPGCVVMTLRAFQPAGGESVALSGEGAHKSSQGGDRPDLSLDLDLTAAELDVLATIESKEPLALFKFAQARRATKGDDSLGVMVERLGAYQHYRERRYSWPSLTEQFKHAFTLSEKALALRAEAKARRDRHVALFTHDLGGDGRGVDVRRLLTDEPLVPIFTTEAPLRDAPLLVEGFEIPVWVRGPEAASREAFELTGDINHSVAFWLWQLAPSIEGLLTELASALPVVHIRLLHGGQTAFANPDTRSDVTGCVTLSLEDAPIVEIRFEDALYAALKSSDNRGEKELMLLVLSGLVMLAEKFGRPVPSRDQVKRIIEEHMGDPLKKHLLVLSKDQPAPLHPRNLPASRLVQEADSQAVKDELAGYLVDDLGLSEGAIPETRVCDVLLKAREWCLKTFRAELGQLRSEGLIERAVLANEALIAERARLRLTLPTRLACYESENETIARLKAEIPRVNLASIVCRFIVECATAQAPRGQRAVSQAALDRLMALGAEMLDHAAALSAVAHGLSPGRFIFTAEGRLEPDPRDPYWRGQHALLSVYASHTLASSYDTFPSHWNRSDRQEAPPDLPRALRVQLDAPLKSECGLTFSELEHLYRCLIGAAYRRCEPAKAARAELLKEIADETGWSTEQVDAGFRFLELRPRSSFYPESGKKADVQPWHFRRTLAYSRRPLLIRTTPAGEEVIWGMRHTHEAGELLFYHLLTGHYQARSKELKQKMGAVSHERGKAFEHMVADLFESRSRSKVLRGRKKLNGKPVVRGDGQDLDVLVADTADKMLLAIETKDLIPSLTPSEVARELGRSFETRGKRKSAMEKHLERLAWLEEHVEDALVEFGLPADDHGDWAVRGLMVTHRAVISAYMTQPPIPILSFSELRAQLESD